MIGARAVRGPIGIGALLAVAILVGLVSWIVHRGGHSDKRSSLSTGAVREQGAVETSPAALRNLAATVRHPIFWLGPRPGETLELTRTKDGEIYIRYLPSGAAIGARHPYLTVATYPFRGAYAAIHAQAAALGAVTVRLADGGIGVLDRRRPGSVHIAYPGVKYQVEVYDPTPARAMQLVSGGKLTHLGGIASTALAPGVPRAASVAGLVRLATRLGHPIYWAGPKPGDTYEVTETVNGGIYIRYLPAHAKVGARNDYLTVATYRFPGAYAAVERASAGASTIRLAHGGIAVVDRAHPQSIHIGYRNVGYQVEVFDPSPSTARELVASGAIAAIR
jgi:hypothetical protein